MEGSHSAPSESWTGPLTNCLLLFCFCRSSHCHPSLCSRGAACGERGWFWLTAQSTFSWLEAAAEFSLCRWKEACEYNTSAAEGADDPVLRSLARRKFSWFIPISFLMERAAGWAICKTHSGASLRELPEVFFFFIICFESLWNSNCKGDAFKILLSSLALLRDKPHPRRLLIVLQRREQGLKWDDTHKQREVFQLKCEGFRGNKRRPFKLSHTRSCYLRTVVRKAFNPSTLTRQSWGIYEQQFCSDESFQTSQLAARRVRWGAGLTVLIDGGKLLLMCEIQTWSVRLCGGNKGLTVSQVCLQCGTFSAHWELGNQPKDRDTVSASVTREL